MIIKSEQKLSVTVRKRKSSSSNNFCYVSAQKLLSRALKEQCDLLNTQMTTDLVTEKPSIYMFIHKKTLIIATMKFTI